MSERAAIDADDFDRWLATQPEDDLWLTGEMAAQQQQWRGWYAENVAPDNDEDTAGWGDAEWEAAEERYVDEHFDHWERQREAAAEGPLNRRWAL